LDGLIDRQNNINIILEGMKWKKTK
jgi:hypothetical protein